jgi:hypothetical protein
VCRPNNDTTSPLEKLTEAFRMVRHDEWRIASEWSKELDLEFNSRSLRRFLDQLVGTALESQRLRSRVTGRLDTHYRPRQVMRDAAKAMISAKGDGINEI